MGGEEETVSVYAASLIEKKKKDIRGGGRGSEKDLMWQLSNLRNQSM